jgi:MoxR-like ATPase
LADQNPSTAFLVELAGNISRVIRGKEEEVRLLIAALVSGGHVLIEDYPGTGKTTLAKALAASLAADFQRIQFTPDLLPTDILGVSTFQREQGTFLFHPGPIFTQVLLADEINRASPRTQSALLEAMGEGQVSVEGETRPLGELFFVIATQNPVELQGTYPLPEAQMDRFLIRTGLGYLESDEEVAMMKARSEGDPMQGLCAVGGVAEIRAARAAAEQIRISDELLYYIAHLVKATRNHPGVLLGAGPRASLALRNLARALALSDGMEFVTPEHVRQALIPVLAHRLVLDNEVRFSGKNAEGLVQEVASEIEPPR